MKVWGVYDDELKELAVEVGLAIRRGYPKRVGRAYQFRLALDDPLPYGGFRFQKRDAYGKGTNHVCWHGQREFLYALFQRFPEAVVDTIFDRYHGAAQFHARYKLTRDMKIPGFVNNAARCTCPIRPKRRVRPRRPSAPEPTQFADAFTQQAITWAEAQEALENATNALRQIEWTTTTEESDQTF